MFLKKIKLNLYYPLLYRYQYLAKDNVLILHTPGHVGSVSMAKSLNINSPDYFFCNVHSLVGNYKIESARHVLQEFLSDNLLSGSFKKPIKIITVVRDPVSRAISGFFHNVNQWIPEKNTNSNRYDKIDELGFYFCETNTHNNQSYLLATTQYQLNWFDNQTKPLFGIDIFERSFDKNKGYEIYKNENIELLVLKLELINKSWGPAMKEFLNLDDIVLLKYNSASNRLNFDLYHLFKNKIKISKRDQDIIYKNRYMNYFYTVDEIAEFINKWSG